MFGWKSQQKPTLIVPPPTDRLASNLIKDELRHLYALIEKLNIPVVMDDHDAGYDTAIDEALEIINSRIQHYT
jgi:hypothetical protein